MNESDLFVKFTRTAVFVTIIFLLTLSSIVFAGNNSLSGTRTVNSHTVFDITVSLDTNPQGDDNYKNDSGSGDDTQNAFERRIEEFSRAVYQSTNGAHKIGKVTIFRNRDSQDTADVVWTENCPENDGPRARPSGFGDAGAHIWMCSEWPGAASLMPTPKGSGYTLAHEWGHYTYGLFDEYAQNSCTADTWIGQPCSTDTAARPSIMNDQWVAARGNAPWWWPLGWFDDDAEDYLEFSTQDIHPFKNDSSGTNAQKRVYGASGWQTLASDSVNDPKFSWLLPRTHYTDLDDPTDPNWIIHDDESTALSELDIRWSGKKAVDLLIDRSGSMSGAPLSNAKTGANLLIDQIQPGNAIGVSSFETNVTRNFAITNIPDPDTGIRASAKSAVNALYTAGVTSLYDGLMNSLADVQAFDANRSGVVYVLSDGMDNDSSATEADVISAYKAAGIPIISFAYGSYAPTGTLFNMANATGGALYQSPTTVADIQKALVEAEAQFSSNVLIASAKVSSTASSTSTRTMPLDSTLASARIILSYSGSSPDFDFKLLLPSGIDSGVTFLCEGTVSCLATLDQTFFTANGYGNYQLRMTNNTGTQKDVIVLVSATPANVETYDIAVGFSSVMVDYPNDLAVFATVTKGPAITGIDVVARVTDPTGSSYDLTLLDDANGADRVANDGTYSASIPYIDNGIYSIVVTASNPDGEALTTYENLSISLKEDGTPYVPSQKSITENFVRVGTNSFIAQGVMSDDHANAPTGGSCTLISDNNADTSGRIDYAGDADCFTFTPSSTDDPIVVRSTSLTSGMNPVLTIYNHSGTVQLAQVNLSTSESPDSGATVTVAGPNIDPLGLVFVVQHTDTNATVGGYKVSAGPFLASDALDTTPPSIGIITPGNNDAVQDSALLTASASDLSDVESAQFSVRKPGGATGVPIGKENLSATFNASTGQWELNFNTLQLTDGDYLLLAKATDSFGNEGWSSASPFIIRNLWPVGFFPSVTKVKAGTPGPVSFSLKVLKGKLPQQSLLNDDLELRVWSGTRILQRAVFGSGPANYTIDTAADQYIMNLITTIPPGYYSIEAWRPSVGKSLGKFTIQVVR